MINKGTSYTFQRQRKTVLLKELMANLLLKLYPFHRTLSFTHMFQQTAQFSGKTKKPEFTYNIECTVKNTLINKGILKDAKSEYLKYYIGKY